MIFDQPENIIPIHHCLLNTQALLRGLWQQRVSQNIQRVHGRPILCRLTFAPTDSAGARFGIRRNGNGGFPRIRQVHVLVAHGTDDGEGNIRTAGCAEGVGNCSGCVSFTSSSCTWSKLSAMLRPSGVELKTGDRAHRIRFCQRQALLLRRQHACNHLLHGLDRRPHKSSHRGVRTRASMSAISFSASALFLPLL